jgi:hypothetical protein
MDLPCSQFSSDVRIKKGGTTLILDHAINASMAMLSLVLLAVFANIFVTAFWGRRILRAIESHRTR